MEQETQYESIRKGFNDPSLPALKILCVEDNMGDFVLVKDHLRHAGFGRQPEVFCASTLKDASGLLQGRSGAPAFDIVFLDLALPDSNGAVTYRRLREACPRVAVIILSGNNDQELAEELVHEGAQDYLLKESLSPDLLRRCAIYALSRQRYKVGLENLAERLKRTTRELRTAHSHLAQLEKLDSISRLAAGVAHEVKNPVGTIQMGLDFLITHWAGMDENCRRTLGYMQEAVDRADAVVHDMLNFSRSDESVKMAPINLNDLVECVLRIVKHECNRSHVYCETSLADDVPQIEGDANKLEQVFINIIMNAVQAMGTGGKIEIRTSRVRLGSAMRDEGLREMNRMYAGDEVALVEFIDNGPGIPEHLLNRVFEPFFTTKPTDEGTGLGLAVSKQIIDLHRGKMEVLNAEGGVGACVRIHLKPHITIRTEPNEAAEKHLLHAASTLNVTP